MTSEPTSESLRDDIIPQDQDEDLFAGGVAVLHLRLAIFFLAVSSLMLSLSAARLVFPDAFSEVAVLSYGRLYPAAINLLVYGWLTLGLIGAAYYILPRVSGFPLRRQRTAMLAACLLAVSYLAGTIAVLAGGNEGRQYLEFPIWIDGLIALGLLLVVRVVTSHVATNRADGLSPADWYFGAAVVWLLLSHVVGGIPGLNGVNATLQTSFYRGTLFGLWFVGAGLGVVYYLFSKITGQNPRRITQLTVAGFWSVTVVFAMASAARLTYTTAPDWLETIGVVFAIGLLVPVAIILVDLAPALRSDGAKSISIRFVVAGAVAFALVPIINLGLGLRSSNVIVGMTEWVNGLDLLILLGAVTFWLLGFIHHASGTLANAPVRTARLHLLVSTVAVLVAVGTLLVSGVQSGLTWLAGANEGFPSMGEGFGSTVDVWTGNRWIGFVSLGLFALAQVWLLKAVWRFGSDPALFSAFVSEKTPADETENFDELEGLPAGSPVPLRLLQTGSVGLFALVALLLFVFPIFETEHREATLLAESSRKYSADTLVETGRDVYLVEGCWYCHTQEVRAIITDVGLGPVARPGDYALEEPAVTGIVRIGPDLMFAGSRGLNRIFVSALLEDPRAVRPWSTMPAHNYLSAGDLAAVSAYVEALNTYETE